MTWSAACSIRPNIFGKGRGDQVNQSGWLPPVNRAMDTMREGVRQAQQALSDGTKQGAGKNERDQQLAQVESLRRQIEQFARGQQPGQQQGPAAGRQAAGPAARTGPGQGPAARPGPRSGQGRPAAWTRQPGRAGIRGGNQNRRRQPVRRRQSPADISAASLDAGIRRAGTICRTAGAWSRVRWFATSRAS